MEQSGINISSIQKLLGHESRQTTEIYLNIDRNSERGAIDVYEKARKKIHTQSLTQSPKPEKNT